MANFCANCGSPTAEDTKFCAVCGAPVIQPETAPQIQNAAPETAPSYAGEAVLGTFGGSSGAAGQIGAILSPIKTALEGIKSFGQNYVGLFKNKRWIKLIAALVLALVWLVLMILSYNGINIGFLNWLTFAKGGAGRSVIGWLGGLLGKTTVAAAFFSLFSGGARSLGGGFKSLFKGANFKLGNLGALFFGAGGALVIYQFFAGRAVFADSMPAISGALVSIMALGRGNGFLYRFATSLTSKKTGGARFANGEKAGALLSGASYGFTLGALLSLIPFGWLPVIVGGASLIAGLVLALVFGNKKEAATV